MPERVLLYILPCLLVVACASPPSQSGSETGNTIQACSNDINKQYRADCMPIDTTQMRTESDRQMTLIFQSIFEIVIQVIINAPNRHQYGPPTVNVIKRR